MLYLNHKGDYAMKKLFYTILLCVMLIFLTSCSERTELMDFNDEYNITCDLDSGWTELFNRAGTAAGFAPTESIPFRLTETTKYQVLTAKRKHFLFSAIQLSVLRTKTEKFPTPVGQTTAPQFLREALPTLKK